MKFYSRNMDSLVGKDREIVSLKRQLDATVDELTESSRGREVALRENRRTPGRLGYHDKRKSGQQSCVIFPSKVNLPCVVRCRPVY